MKKQTYFLDGKPCLETVYIPGRTLSIRYNGADICTDKLRKFGRGKQLELSDGRTLTATCRTGIKEPYIHLQLNGTTLESPEVTQVLRREVKGARWKIWLCFSGYLLLAAWMTMRNKLFASLFEILTVIMPVIAWAVALYTFWLAVTFWSRKGWHCIPPSVASLFFMLVSIGTLMADSSGSGIMVGACVPVAIVLGVQMLKINIFLSRGWQFTDGHPTRLRDVE